MMAEVKYVVICDGEEKMLFTSKKESDVWDKMFYATDLLGTLSLSSSWSHCRCGWSKKQAS